MTWVRLKAWWSRGDGLELLFGDAVVQGGLDGRPGVPDGCRWVVRVVVEVFDEFSGVVARSSSGLEDESDQVDAVVPVELVLFFAFGHVAWTTTGGKYGDKHRRKRGCVLPCRSTTISMRAPSVRPGWVDCASPGMDCSMYALVPVCVVTRSATHLASAKFRWSTAVRSFPAEPVLAVWSASWFVAWSRHRWRLRSFFVVAFKSRLVCAASLRRTARVPPGRLVAQRCMKTGWCV